MASEAVDELIGRSVGEFVLRDRIGSGGFGAVYRAVQTSLAREAVVKVLHGAFRSDEEVVQRFLREAKLASRLDHPYVAHIYAFGLASDGLLWIAMEYVRGQPLDRFLRERGALPLGDLVPFFEHLCEVVQAAHDRGVIHRDIKPANVMVLSRVGRLLPKLLDLGIAKMVTSDGAQIADTLLGNTDSRDSSDDHPTMAGQDRTLSRRAPVTGDDATVSSNRRDASGSGDAVTAIVQPAMSQRPVAVTGEPSAMTGKPSTDPSGTDSANTGGDDATALAPRTGQPARASLTQAGQMMGTPAYMAPEQWDRPDEADARTDVYALGVLAFEALTGRRPFEGRSQAELAAAHLAQPVPPVGRGLPAALDPVLAKAMAKRAEDRYGSPMELATALREAAGLSHEAQSLPRLPEAVRDAWVTSSPQPIAASIALLDASRNVHQARDAVWGVSRALIRYLVVAAVACRTRLSEATTARGDTRVVDLLRTLREHGLGDNAWLELGRDLVRPYRDRPEAHPIPQLVTLLVAEGREDPFARLLERATPTDSGARGEDQLREHLAEWLVALDGLLRRCEFLFRYPLGVTRDGQLESWMGLPPPRRAVLPTQHKQPEGQAVLVDRDGGLVVALHPLAQVARPSPTRDPEMFLLEGNAPIGARMVSMPVGYERRDEHIWDWFGDTFVEVADKLATETATNLLPYRGLSSFSSRDAAMFFGRERRVESFVNRLRIEPFLAVVGPSGAGKTSFIQAGVIPALPPRWWTIASRPGRAPLASLEAALAKENITFESGLRRALDADRDALAAALRQAGQSRGNVVVTIEQLEEAFVLCTDESERELYLEALVSAARNPDDPLRLIVTLRDDFLVRAQAAPAFRERLGHALEIVTTPGPEDLLRILIEPARRAGYAFEDPELPAEMVREVVDQPGGLALLSFTASRLWEVRDRASKKLTRDGYQSLGGVGGALAQHAEATLETLNNEQRRLVREAFRHLVTAEGTRAVLSRDDLMQLLGGDAHADAVVERLVGARLLVTHEGEGGDDKLEIVHEALVSAWPRLKAWVREDAEGARFRDQLRAAARQWDERGRIRGLLLRDEALVDFQRWRARDSHPLTSLEREFADASTRYAARGRRIRRAALATFLTFLSASVVLLLLLNNRAKEERIRAESERARAEEHLLGLYEENGRQALLARDYFRAAAYLSASYSDARNQPALRFLLAEALRPLRRTSKVLPHPDVPTWASYAPRGDHLISGSHISSGEIRIWRRDGTLLHAIDAHRGGTSMAAFDPSGTHIATAGGDGVVKLWRVADGQLVASLAHDEEVRWVAYSPSGDRLASGSADDRVRIFSAEGQLLHTLDGHTGDVVHLSWSPNGEHIATASEDATARLWSSRTGRQLTVWDDRDGALTRALFSPDGAMVATSSVTGIARLRYMDGRGEGAVLAGHLGAIEDLAFNRDGNRLATAGGDGTAKLWDTTSGRLVASLEGHRDDVLSVAFSPDGRRCLTASFDGTARLWDDQGTPLAELVGHSSLLYDAVFDPNGQDVVTVSADGTLRMWSADLDSSVEFVSGHDGAVRRVVFSADGRRLLTTADDGTARIWDSVSHEQLDVIHIDPGVELAVFLASGLALVDNKAGKVTVADAGGRPIGTLEVDKDTWWAEVSPVDGALMTVSSDTATLWDPNTLERVQVFPASSARFAADGRVVVARGDQIEVRRADDYAVEASARAHRGAVWYALPCQGGSRVISMGGDGSIRHWDSATGELIRSAPLKLNYVGFEVTPDCRFIVALGDRGLATVLDADNGRVLNYVESRAQPGWFTMDPTGSRVAVVEGDRVVLWELERIESSPAEVSEWTRCHVPYRIEGADLSATTAPPSNCSN